MTEKEAGGAELDQSRLVERILAFADQSGASTAADTFDGLALDCLSAQARQVGELVRWSAAGSTDHWSDLPPWPSEHLTAQGPCWGTVEAEFHATPPRLAEIEQGQDAAVGGAVRCQPLLDLQRDLLDLQVVERSLFGCAVRPPVLILSPPRVVALHEEGAFLAEHLVERWSGEGTRYAAGAGGLHSAKARQWLQERADGSVWLLGSQVALHDLCVELERAGQQLSAGAVCGVVAIAGVHSEQPAEEELAARAASRLGLAPNCLHVLLNHPALSSLPLRRGDEPVGEFTCPRWLRAAVLDDDDVVHRAPGTEGRLAFLALANLGTACWVATTTRGRLGEAGRFVVSRDRGAASPVN